MPLLFSEVSEGWLAAVFAGLTALMSGGAAVWQSMARNKVESRKADIEQEQMRTTYLFQQYQEQFARVRQEHAEDRVLLASLSEENSRIKIREATLTERVGTLELRIEKQTEENVLLRKRIEELVQENAGLRKRLQELEATRPS